MPNGSKDYRPDFKRCVCVFGEIQETLVNEVSKEILRLRSESAEPITVFINSPGGSIRGLEILDGSFRGKDPDGQTCRIITVASGDALSAAATLLAYGDYAIAQTHSRIYFHGARLTEREITTEDASSLANQLNQRNRDIGFHVAEQVINRLVHRYSAIRGEFLATKPDFSEWDFMYAVQYRCSSLTTQLVSDVIEQVTKSAKLYAQVLNLKAVQVSDGTLKADLAVFQRIIHFRKTESKNPKWRMDEREIHKAVNDYLLIRDFIFGDHTSLTESLTDTFGQDFFNPDQLLEY